MRRKRSTPWIHRWSRPIMAGVASLGAIVTAYMTYTKLTGSSTACPIEGCNIVLSSPYASVFGLPLALFGYLAYGAMAAFAVAPMLLNSPHQKRLREDVELWTGFFLFWGATAMVVFSGYLMLLLAFVIKAVCIYCLISALCSATLFVLSIAGRDWEDISQLFFGGIITLIVMGIGSFGLFAISNPQFAQAQKTTESEEFTVETSSGESEIALAKHLNQVGAKFYGAFWCPHCQNQKQMFGNEAMEFVPYVECSPPDRRGRTAACEAAGIQSYPTWIINGQTYNGVQALEKLAQVTGYQGSRVFNNPPVEVSH
jgi:uncharacterized membrane protein